MCGLDGFLPTRRRQETATQPRNLLRGCSNAYCSAFLPETFVAWYRQPLSSRVSVDRAPHPPHPHRPPLAPVLHNLHPIFHPITSPSHVALPNEPATPHRHTRRRARIPRHQHLCVPPRRRVGRQRGRLRRRDDGVEEVPCIGPRGV